MSRTRRDVELSVQAKYQLCGSNHWEDCYLQLSPRYIYIVLLNNVVSCQYPIPSILSVEADNVFREFQWTLKIISNTNAFWVAFANHNDMNDFQSNAYNILKTSTRILLGAQDIIFSTNNADEEFVDSTFGGILNGLFSCREPKDLKSLLGKVNEYQKTADFSILEIQKPFYLRFVNCLRYLSDELVTDELMQYAENLINGFDDTVDNALAGEELKPTPVNLKSVFRVEGVLGKGKYGIVYYGLAGNPPKRMALKRIAKSMIQKNDVKTIMQEAAIMYKLRRHPHIVGIQAFWEDQSNYYLVQDIMEGGELFNWIVERKSFSEADAQRVVMTLLYTLDYCHERGIVHRDLKPENILLAERDNLDSIRIADFGLAHQFDIAGQLNSYCGTPGYIAPEIISKHSYGPEVDMWSLGVIAYILLCGYHPFPQNDDVLLQRNILGGVFDFRGSSWVDKSEESKDFITRLLCVNPQQRMTARQAMNHRWMMFQSKSTMNMNRAVQELERFNARKNAHAVDVSKAAERGIRVENYITLVDTLVYTIPSLSQTPVCTIPRGSVVAIDNFVISAEGPWLHVFDMGGGASPTAPDGKWVLAGKKKDNPQCIPVNKSVYLSRYKRDKAFHFVKPSPSRSETTKEQLHGGYCIVVDDVIQNDEGMWGVINKITLAQFNITIQEPVYVCLVLGDNTVLFNKIYGKLSVC